MLASDGDQPLPPLPTNTPLKVYQFLFIVHSTFFLIVFFVKVFQICMAACLMLASDGDQPLPPLPTNTPLKVYQFLFIVHSTFFLIVSFVKVFQICMAACLMLALWWWSAPPPTPHKHSPESVSIPLYCSFYLLPDSFLCESLPDLYGGMFNVGIMMVISPSPHSPQTLPWKCINSSLLFILPSSW